MKINLAPSLNPFHSSLFCWNTLLWLLKCWPKETLSHRNVIVVLFLVDSVLSHDLWEPSCFAVGSNSNLNHHGLRILDLYIQEFSRYYWPGSVVLMLVQLFNCEQLHQQDNVSRNNELLPAVQVCYRWEKTGIFWTCSASVQRIAPRFLFKESTNLGWPASGWSHSSTIRWSCAFVFV